MTAGTEEVDRNVTLYARLLPWLRGAFSVALLAFLASYIDVDNALAILKNSNVPVLLLALAIGTAIFFFSAYRWYVLIDHNAHDVTYSQCVRLGFISSFLGLFMPGMAGVEAVRVYGMSRATSELAYSFTSVFVDRLLAFIAQFAIAAAVLAIVPIGVPESVKLMGFVGFIALCAGSAALMSGSMRKLSLWMLPGNRLQPIRNFLTKVYGALDAYRDQPVLMAWAVFLAVMLQVIRAGYYWTVSFGLGLDVTLVAFLIALPVVNVIMFLPISIAGLGTRELTFMVLLAPFAVSSEAAYTMSLVAFILGAVLPSLIGGYMYARSGVHKEKA